MCTFRRILRFYRKKTKIMEKHIRQIALLIFKQITGSLLEEEERILNEWRNQDEKNEALYQKLTDSLLLEKEYHRLNQIKTERPLADMKARIKRHSMMKQIIRYGIAASILALFTLGSVMLYQQKEENKKLQKELYARKIQPGQTQATLVLSNGEAIRLDTDTQKNQEIIDRKKKVSAQLLAKTEKNLKPKTNQLITPKGGEFKIILEDSTEIWLNAESKLIYPETFGKDERRVVVQGEAYFKVKKNTDKPFFVETDGQLVKVYGTEFNIRSYKEDVNVYTTLVNGSISIRPQNGNHSELIITPNNQAVFRKTDETTKIRKVNTEVITCWKEGMFVFEEQNLEQIMQNLSRWYNFTYTFKDTNLKNIVFMGSINRYAEFDDVIEILEKSGGIHFNIKNRHIQISKK